MTAEPQPICKGPPPTSEHIDKISASLAKAQAEVAKVVKNEETKGEGKFTYTYATLDTVMAVVKAVQAANGLAIVQRPDENFLHTILAHSSGQWIDYGKYPLGNAGKHQERGSSLTYARRYVTCAIFGIAPEEDDDGAKGNDSLGKPTPPSNYEQPHPAVRSNAGFSRSDNFAIDPIIKDGNIDFDAFAAEFESKVTSAASVMDVSSLKRANAKILNAMKPERPDLFNHLAALSGQIANSLM